MYSNVADSSDSKRLWWATISAAIIFSLLVLFSISSRAGASALTPKGPSAPPPAPTTPPTLAPATSTPRPNLSVTPTRTAVGNPTATRTPAGNPTATRTAVGNPTGTAVASSPTPQRTPTVPHPVPTSGQPPISCGVSFTDVQPGAWFYNYVMWMACSNVVNGYQDGTFRPGNSATRGQIVKIVVGAFGLTPQTAGGPHYADAPADSTFYQWIETASYYNIVNGYPCGGDGEPCNAQNQPYYRPNNNVTRAQLTKILVLAAEEKDPTNWPLLTPAQATFADVPSGSTFYSYVETAFAHTLIDGYVCGDAGEPCPGRYFRPNGTASRAQLSKMVYQALVP